MLIAFQIIGFLFAFLLLVCGLDSRAQKERTQAMFIAMVAVLALILISIVVVSK